MLNALAKEVFDTAVDKGFWDVGVEARNQGEMIALMHEELSGALEALRHGDYPDEHCPEYSRVTVKMADTMIRVLDFCHAYGLPLQEALFAKMEANKRREHKHGKRF